MKIKSGFMLREVAGNFIVVPVGEASKSFRGLINLNSTGAFLWKCLEQECTKEDLVSKLMQEYEIDEATATQGVNKFLEKISADDRFLQK